MNSPSHPSIEFDPETALAYAQELSRPRRVGTGEDETVARDIATKLATFGYQVEEQSFRFSAAPGFFLAAEIFAGQLVILLTLILQNYGVIYPILGSLTLLLVLVGSGPFNKAVQKGSIDPGDSRNPTFWSRICGLFGYAYPSRNIIASTPYSLGQRKIPHLYFVAHYDSKSQRIPLPVRIGLFVLVIFGAVLFSALILLGIVFPALNPVTPWLGGVIVVLCIPLLLLDFGNQSPGAVDNASGLGTALHLAESFIAHSALVNQIDLTFLFTGAEEAFLMGAWAFVQRNEEELREQVASGGVNILIVDGIGIDGQLYYAGKRGLPNDLPGIPLSARLEESR